ncbi:hypothetical protein LIER_40415 [Lithospermum erythrorhizon]|uniref:Uncharacterized protein n=1 Tax=Lithospermum erythrorhizon TaxID=34254 RepID=A0AAV3QVD0_LITER
MAPALHARGTKKGLQKEYPYLGLLIIAYVLLLVFIAFVLLILLIREVFKKFRHKLIPEIGNLFLEMRIYTWEVRGDPLTEPSNMGSRIILQLLSIFNATLEGLDGVNCRLLGLG